MVVSEKGYPFEGLPVQPLPRKPGFLFFGAIFSLLNASIKAIGLLRQFKPDVVVATGSYVSAPVLLASTLTRKTFMLHEQNAWPGLTNRVFSFFASAIAVSFPDSVRKFPAWKKRTVTGNPVRLELLELSRRKALEFFDLESEVKTVLIFGGSQGSQSINQAVIQAYPLFDQFREVQIIHLTGPVHFEKVKSEIDNLKKKEGKVVYRPYAFLEEMGQAYAAADLVVCRSGATTISEITTLGLPAVLSPYPYATANHQEKNARSLEKAGAARVVLDRDLNGQTLFDEVVKLIYNPAALERMGERSRSFGRPEAAKKIANLILSIKASSEIVETSVGEDTEEIEW